MTRVQLIVAAVVFLIPSLIAAQTKTSSALATDLRVGGDDGLTRRFAGALTEAIGRSSNFVLSGREDENALRLTIPTNIYWKEAKGRLNFQYVVVLTDRHSRYLGVSIGACWEDDMLPCVNKVLVDAGAAWQSGFTAH